MPAVAECVVYVGSFDGLSVGRIRTLNASTGDLIWSYTTSNDVDPSPAVVNGMVYVGSGDKKVYGLNASNGNLVCSYTTGGKVTSSPAVAYGRVYVGSSDHKVYCFNATTGALVWSYETGANIGSSPAVADGKVFIGSDDGKVYAFGSGAAPTYRLNVRTTDSDGNVLTSSIVSVEGVESRINNASG